jgi:branched-chain amino acid transport system ATP-binding protein
MDIKPRLKVNNLSISFGGIKALDNLTFDVRDKEIYGLIGPNGAGKTTVFNCITQFYKPDLGEVVFYNRNDEKIDLVRKKTHQIIKEGLVRSFQNIELIHDMSLIDNVLVGAHIEYKTGILSHGLRLKSAIDEEEKFKKKAEEVLAFLGLKSRMNELVKGQPYGVLKKVELGRTLMSHPKMILLDEPAAGLDDSETIQMARLLRSVRDHYQCSILLVEHDMRLVMDVCDRICAISFGKKLGEGTAFDIQNNKEVQEAYLGREEEDE